MEWRFDSADQIYPSTMRDELHEHGASDSDFASAELIFGELIGNAIRHARGKVCVRLDWNAEFPVLSVRDLERHFSQPLDLPNDPFAESGRGLFIVRALAKEFRLTDDEDDGSAACATLPVRRRED